ncbi:MAG: hydrogenase iron-sulfur subunit [Desulfovibrio sp.]|uniref:hydrogenase iron-sulfur subunit n=1 Tax=Desulfovibrio sp. TaxID=885 RepID=UPI00258E13DD|nr:hydrogenase iron-sulfur subunit [Desulfovibrio sp.]MCD7982944.1 hydrogenase iron-sulfur subunit [Desulfovibrio sp.]
MAGKIGVYFDLQNIGGGLDVEALAAQTRDKWGDLTAVVKVVPLLAGAVDEIKADIEAQSLDGVLLCGASPRVDGDLYRFPVQVEHVNLREQCVLAYRNPDNSLVDGEEAPELLTLMARDYVNMGVVKLQKSEVPDSAAITGVARMLVIGGGWTGLTAAAEAAATGYEVVLVEKADKLGGAANNIPTGSPLGPLWTEKQSTNLAAKIEKVTGDAKITVHCNAHMEKLEGQPGEFTAVIATSGGPVTVQVGAVVLATGWVPLDEKYLAPMGLGVSPKVVHAAQFGKMLVAGEVTARRIAFVLDTTLAEEAVRKAAEEAAEAPAEAAKPAPEGEEGEAKPFVKEDLESIKHLQYSNAVNSVGMLRLANTICEKTDDATQAFILYKDMTVPGILERFYKKMQDRLGVMMTKADVTEIRDHGDRMVVSCKNTLLGMDFDLDVDLVVLPTGLVPTTAKDVTVNFDYRQGPDFPDLDLFDGFADSNYICFPYETRRTGVYAAGCVRQPLTMDACEEDARGAVLKAVQCIEAAEHGVAVHPRSGDRSYPVFNFVRCTQCKRCTEECPFGALDDDEKGTPKPNPARCRRCGTCFGACPERVISFANYNIDQIGSMIREVQVPKDFKKEGPRILILACENDAYPALDMAGMRRKAWSPYCRIIPVRCLGSVNAIWVSDAMSKGFDGVMLLGCKYGDDYQCHFVKGSEICNRRKENIAETLNRLGVQPERVDQLEVAIDEYDKVPDLIDGFVARITAMGPNPFKGM